MTAYIEANNNINDTYDTNNLKNHPDQNDQDDWSAYINFDNGNQLHYQTVITMLRQKSIIYRSFGHNYELDFISNMTVNDQVNILKVFRNLNYIGIVCEMLAKEISDNNGDIECDTNDLSSLLFTTFNSSMNIDDLLEMSQAQVNFAPDLF